MKKKNIVVIGGGPAGMMASIAASLSGENVILVEKNHRPGKKLLITGNGRCNFTNSSGIGTFLSKFGRNGGFLRDAFKALSPSALIEFFEKRGLRCKTDENGRVFPSDDRSSSILNVLENELERLNVTVLNNTCCTDIFCQKGKISEVLISAGKTLACRSAILSTGGVSYPSTGSTGDGFRFSLALGHTIVAPRPGLVPVIVKEHYPGILTGVSVSDVSLKIIHGAHSIKAGKGDIMFTSRGLSGPLILSNSGTISKLLETGVEISVSLDIFPGMSYEKLDSILSGYLRTQSSKSVRNCLKGLVTKRLNDVILGEALSDPDKRSNQVTREERSRIVSICKDFRLTITGTHPIEEAMVTIGGVSLKDIDPKTMSSRKVSGLYFAGEIMDIAGDTGGFNLQAAFSTGFLSGISAAESLSPPV